MDVREKLVELIKKFVPTVWYEDCDEIRHEKCDEIHCSECIAERLIAHGVMVQEWISVKDRLPEHGDVVLCFMKFGEHRILQWDNVSSWWLGYGQGNDWQKSDVTHWSKMPQPPKGE